jgi:hypothetical protein
VRETRHLPTLIAVAVTAIAVTGCAPATAPVSPSDAERNRAVTQQGLSGSASSAPTANPALDRNTAATQQGLGAAGVPNPNPPGPGR